MDAARANLPALERFAVAILPSDKDNENTGPVLEVAKLWRKLGDEAHPQALLTRLYDAPPATTVARRGRGHAMIYSGFLDEGNARLGTLPTIPRDMQYYPSIAYWEATYQPHQFPERIGKIQSPRQRLEELVDFVKGLAEPMFATAEERELVLSQGGYSASY